MFGWLLFVCMGCDDAPEPAVSACELLAQQRMACDASTPECQGEAAECRAGCVLGLACIDLIDPSREPGAIACLEQCAPKFTCENGDEVPTSFRCDHQLDCALGEDEENCP